MRTTYGRLRAPLSIIAAMIAGLLAVPALASAAPAGSGFQDNGITLGPDGNVWFSVFNTHRVGRITPAGAVQQFAGATGGPVDIVTGPDGALWFTEYGNRVGRVTTGGKVTEFPVPFGNYRGIAAGSDGRLWLVDKDGDELVAVTPAGKATTVPLGGGSPEDIVTGPDGNLWVTLGAGRAIARVIPSSGAFVKFDLPSPGVGNPAGITVGPDNALWFSEANSTRIGRMTTDGALTDFPGPLTAGGVYGIATGPDGALWIANQDSSSIARLTPAGVAGASIPTPGGRPIQVTLGADHNIWFTQNGRDAIGRVGATGPVTQFPVDTTAPKAKITTKGTPTGARATVRCSEACRVSAELLAPRALARQLGVAGRGPLVSLGRSSKAALGRKHGIAVRVSRGVAAKLAARGPTALRFVFTVRDGQTNEFIFRRTVTV